MTPKQAPDEYVPMDVCDDRHRGTKWIIGVIVGGLGLLLTAGMGFGWYGLCEARYAANTADEAKSKVVAIQASEDEFRKNVLGKLTELAANDRSLQERVDKVLYRLTATVPSKEPIAQ